MLRLLVLTLTIGFYLAASTQPARAGGNPGYVVIGSLLSIVAVGSTLGAIDKASDIRDYCVDSNGDEETCDQLKQERNALFGVALLSGLGALWSFSEYEKSGRRGLINVPGDGELTVSVPRMSLDLRTGRASMTIVSATF